MTDILWISLAGVIFVWGDNCSVFLKQAKNLAMQQTSIEWTQVGQKQLCKNKVSIKSILKEYLKTWLFN